MVAAVAVAVRTRDAVAAVTTFSSDRGDGATSQQRAVAIQQRWTSTNNTSVSSADRTRSRTIIVLGVIARVAGPIECAA
jgi:hypothetical protein